MGMKTRVLWDEIRRLNEDNELLENDNLSAYDNLEKAIGTASALLSTLREVNTALKNAQADYQADWNTEDRGRLDSQDAAYKFGDIIKIVERRLMNHMPIDD